MLPESISQAASELLFDAWTFLCQGAKKVLSPLLPTPEDKLRYICEETGNVSSLVELLNENPTLLSPKSPVFYFTEGRAGYSPLTLAARSGHLGIVCYLIKNDLALPDEMDKRWGATAVHHAARKNSTVTLTFLLEEAGANVSALTNEKFQRASALHWAASHGNIDAAKVRHFSRTLPIPSFLSTAPHSLCLLFLFFFLLFSVLRSGFTTQRCRCQPSRRERLHPAPLGIIPWSSLVRHLPYWYVTKRQIL